MSPKAKKPRKRTKRLATMSSVDSGTAFNQPELVFGLAAAVGTPLDFFASRLDETLRRRGYQVETIRLSSLMEAFRLNTRPPPDGAKEYERLQSLMTRGDELRKKLKRGDILALCAAAQINSKRSTPETQLPGKAFILRQLKHPDEVYRLRQIYGDGFHLLGLYAPTDSRRKNLIEMGMTENQTGALIQRDEDEGLEFGQKLRDTFHLADAFVKVLGSQDQDETQKQLQRFVDLLFGSKIETPTKDEFGMSLAQAGALRSSSLSRQVGAAILTKGGEILSIGTNEVPSFGGGLYWGDGYDKRDHRVGQDSSDAMKRQILLEILETIVPGWTDLSTATQKKKLAKSLKRLEGSRLMGLTEFGRAVHAEMEAISAAARLGAPIKDAILYTTTFPCHVCTKHIVAAGISRVVFIEPYPKSLAYELHSDSVAVEGALGGDTPDVPRVIFEPFVGISPRRYSDLFSIRTREGRSVRRKDAAGRPLEGALGLEGGLRLQMSPFSYLIQEGLAARQLQQLIGQGGI